VCKIEDGLRGERKGMVSARIRLRIRIGIRIRIRIGIRIRMRISIRIRIWIRDNAKNTVRRTFVREMSDNKLGFELLSLK